MNRGMDFMTDIFSLRKKPVMLIGAAFLIIGTGQLRSNFVLIYCISYKLGNKQVRCLVLIYISSLVSYQRREENSAVEYMTFFSPLFSFSCYKYLAGEQACFRN